MTAESKTKSSAQVAKLDGLVKKLYESNATGKLSDRHFERLLADYDNEQATLETIITELTVQINTWSEDKLRTDKFIELVKRYTDFSELTTPMLNDFLDCFLLAFLNKIDILIVITPANIVTSKLSNTSNGKLMSLSKSGNIVPYKETIAIIVDSIAVTRPKIAVDVRRFPCTSLIIGSYFVYLTCKSALSTDAFFSTTP